MKNPRQKPVNTEPFKQLYSFRSRYLDIGGMKYHFVDEGMGDPVLMLHGNPTWSFYYRRLIKRVSQHRRVLAPDHIGCGLSDKPGEDQYDFRLKSRVSDLSFFIDSLDLDRPLTLIVHDWGGMIGMAWAVRNPHRVRGIVVMNTAAFSPPDNKPIPARLWIIRNLAMISRPAVLGLNLFSVAALFMASKKGLEPRVKKGLVAPYNCPNNRLATLKFVQDIPLTPSDPSYSIVQNTEKKLSVLEEKPMLICWGMKDFVFDSDYLNQWIKYFPHARILRFPDAGHYVLEDNPQRVCHAVELFLKNIST